MKKSQQLNGIKKLVKIQEQMVLIEFRELRRKCDALKSQINDLSRYKEGHLKKLKTKSVYSSELSTIKFFNEKLEHAIGALRNDLQRTENSNLMVGEKIKEIRMTLVSVHRLMEKYQAIENNAADLVEQRQIEENINYTQSAMK